METLRQAVRKLGVWLLVLLTVAMASLLALLLINTPGIPGIFLIGVTVVVGLGLGGAAVTWMEPRMTARAFAMATAAIGFLAASIALSIALAATSWEWQALSRNVPHAGRSVISFTLFALVFLWIGIPRLRESHERGEVLRRPEAPERAKIQPSRSRRNNRSYRTP